MDRTTQLSAELLSSAKHKSRAIRIIPSSQSHQEQLTALETTMQSLVLDKKHPLALEVVGAGERRSFLVRANSEVALEHAEGLLRGQYPQIEIQYLQEDEDPFRLDDGEDVSAVEMIETTATDSHRPAPDIIAGSPKTDPLLGLLATLGKLPPNTRAILQVGLVPFTTSNMTNRLRAFFKGTWGSGMILGKSHIPSGNKSSQSMGGAGLFIMANVLLLGIAYLCRTLIPNWVLGVFSSIFRGNILNMPPAVEAQIIAVAVVILTIEALLFIGIELFSQALLRVPDLRLVYRTRIRLYVIGPKRTGALTQNGLHQLREEREQAERRQGVLLRMATAYRQFRTSSGTYFITREMDSSEGRLLLSRDVEKPGHGWLRGLASSHRLLSVEALATLWHLPPTNALPELEFVDYRRSRTLLMPFEVARQCENLAPVGYSEHGVGGRRSSFGFIPQFFSYHTLISGRSGEGKSAFLAHLSREAMIRGGLVLIDPYGELCEQVLQIVPPSRAEDVVLVDLDNDAASVGLNPLDVMLGRARDTAISDLLKMLAHIWVSSWGAKMENAFEMSLRTLFEANRVLVAKDSVNGPQRQHTMLDVLPLLTNAKFCHSLLQEIEDDYLHRWWREYYEPLSLVQQRDVINPIINKVAKFERIAARRIVGQSLSTLNIRQMIKDQKIILLKLSRSVVGSDVAALIGATVLGLIQVTLEESGQQAKNAYNKLPIILDEFQMLAGADYRTLVELQKYGVTFFLATQSLEYLQKLNPVLLPTVLANTKQTVSFNMAAQDAELICRELEVRSEDLLHLDTQSCYISLIAAQQRQPTFSVKVSPLPEGDTTVADSIRTRCRIRYTRPIAEVDDMLRDALLRSIRINVPTRERDRDQENFPSPTQVFPVEEQNTRTVSSSLEPERNRERIPQDEERRERIPQIEERYERRRGEEERSGSSEYSHVYKAVGSEESADSHFNEDLEDIQHKEELELMELKMFNRNEDEEEDEDEEGEDYYEFGNNKQQRSDGKSENNRAGRQQEYFRRLQQNQ